MDIQIIPAEVTDAPKLLPLLEQLGYPSGLAQLQAFITYSSAPIFLAKQAEQCVGLLSLSYSDYLPGLHRMGRIMALVVDEPFRGQGIGKELIAFAKSEAKANQCDQLELTTALHRQSTHHYYQSLGFSKASYRFVIDLIA